jgi:multicomponent K+:H+ antiporter subunit E/multicomponent Na+:H+ antiporter subunit E
MTRLAVPVTGLTAVYALTLASADPIDLLTGAVLSVLLLRGLVGRLRLEPRGDAPRLHQRLIWFVPFAAAALADVAAGTWDVALRVLHLRPAERPGLLRVPIGARSERGVAVSALVTTLSPGTVLVDIDWERRDMLLHVIDASDPDGVRQRLLRFYDRYQKRVFP